MHKNIPNATASGIFALIKQVFDGLKELFPLGGLVQRAIQLTQQFLLFGYGPMG